jgi:hypothetical protein
MSGLLERIVRRRRASAGRRLGPAPSSNGAAEDNGGMHANGAAAETAIRALLQTPPVLAEDRAPAEALAEPPAAPEPGFRERARMRRRVRYLRRLREVQLRDIGGFVLELQRLERERPDLVQAKVEGAARTDAELRGLERALHEQQTLRELRVAGIGGACAACGAVHGSEDRFCASCGEPLREEDETADEDPVDHGQVYPE